MGMSFSPCPNLAALGSPYKWRRTLTLPPPPASADVISKISLRATRCAAWPRHHCDGSFNSVTITSLCDAGESFPASVFKGPIACAIPAPSGFVLKTARDWSGPKGFMDYDLGYFDLETRVLEPLKNPFGPKLLPMS
jgi:hypothetical protein